LVNSFAVLTRDLYVNCYIAPLFAGEPHNELALFLTLAVASAQDMCQLSLFSALPTLQPLYTNYKNGNWVALEKTIENIIPTSQFIILNCLNYTFLSTDPSQKCLKSVYSVARMFAPLADSHNDSNALVHLVNNFAVVTRELYTHCFFSPLVESEDALALFESFDAADTEDFEVKDIACCIGDASRMVPLFKAFIDDVKGKKGFDAVSDDLKVIFANLDPLCNDCGIPKPKGKGGPVDVGACLVQAEFLADDAYLIVKSKLDFTKIISGINSFIAHLPAALSQCGILA